MAKSAKQLQAEYRGQAKGTRPVCVSRLRPEAAQVFPLPRSPGGCQGEGARSYFHGRNV